MDLGARPSFLRSTIELQRPIWFGPAPGRNANPCHFSFICVQHTEIPGLPRSPPERRLPILAGYGQAAVIVSTISWIGAIAGQRMPVLRGPITGLPIPADAEIAIEGFVSKGDLQDEGPFGEFTGYHFSASAWPVQAAKLARA